MSQAEPTSSAQLKKEWLRREKEALARLGFKHRRRDLYRIRLGEDWAGEVGVHKRAATGPALMVYTDAVSVLLNHLPTQRLMRELYELGPKESDVVIMGGDLYGVPSDESRDAIRSIRPSSLSEIDAAVGALVRMAEEEALPWMRSQATMGALVASLSTPRGSAGMEPQRLEKVAAVDYLRGDKKGALAALRTLREEHMPSGVPVIDERREKFCRALQDRLDEM